MLANRIMNPNDCNEIDEDDFELITSQKANNLIDVRKYKSKKTGLSVVIAQVEGPIVNGYFTLGKQFLILKSDSSKMNLVSFQRLKHMMMTAFPTRLNTSYSWAVRITLTKAFWIC